MMMIIRSCELVSGIEVLCYVLFRLERIIEGICNSRRLYGSKGYAQLHSSIWSEMLAVALGRLSRNERESLGSFRGAVMETERGSPPDLGPRDSFSSAS